MTYPTIDDIEVTRSHTRTNYLELLRSLLPKGPLWGFKPINIDNTDRLLAEDDSALLLEDGSGYILLEG